MTKQNVRDVDNLRCKTCVFDSEKGKIYVLRKSCIKPATIKRNKNNRKYDEENAKKKHEETHTHNICTIVFPLFHFRV